MKKFFVLFAVLTAGMTISCNKAEIAFVEKESVNEPTSSIMTKAVGEKEPTTFVYVETNDVNPLNALDYYLNDGGTFFDYVCMFAANVHKTTTVNNEVQPTLYLNPELCPYLCDNGSPITTYTEPFHDQDQRVILGVLNDWQNFGLSTMNTTQQQQFAYILCCVVTQCGFDGVLFDDEYSGTNTIVSGSYSGIIDWFKYYCPDKEVFVFDWGGTNYISSTAASKIDYAHHGYFPNYLSYSYSNITGMNAARWSPISINIGQTYNNTYLNYFQSWAANAANNNYGQIMFFNLRSRCDVDPLPVLNKIAAGAGWDTPVTSTGGCRAPLSAVTGGCTITYDMALNCCN